MSEEMILRHCAPTLARLKTGSMFSCAFEDEEELKGQLRRINKILVKKGLRVLPLRWRDGRVLIYVYRPSHLRRDLENSKAQAILQQRGYGCCQSAEQCIVHLIKRIGESESFPHEIGIFLGYPLEDVCGFIENKACKSKCTGCWKVYGDEENAQKLFAKYKKCTDIYCSRWAEGGSFERLAVAG